MNSVSLWNAPRILLLLVNDGKRALEVGRIKQSRVVLSADVTRLDKLLPRRWPPVFVEPRVRDVPDLCRLF